MLIFHWFNITVLPKCTTLSDACF